ncbi:alanine racemase [Desulfofundulus thermocisternus]|uniref:alanine racemase n=1 Tax=Desulfofundulus thermocisternus TaxID=42471 RepID=UPI00217E383C|nr:alanine racemase [Desulfofundulus thermocisternus]MCS5694947.1 alanine racemase [Desulfofundulus thermocisternus]
MAPFLTRLPTCSHCRNPLASSVPARYISRRLPRLHLSDGLSSPAWRRIIVRATAGGRLPLSNIDSSFSSASRNLSSFGEETKYGLPPGEVRSFVAGVAELPGIRVRGLMTIAPLVSDPEQARPIFRELYQMASWLKQELPVLPLDFLSMGMSNDFTVAVGEGANIIRVGSAIFGPRPNPRRDNHGEKIGG